MEHDDKYLLNLNVIATYAGVDAKKFLIAYSGGLDSHTLLHAMMKLRENNPEIELHAIHVNHGLSINADAWAKHCEVVCQLFKIPLQICKVDLSLARIKGESIEAAARTERYKVFAANIKKNQCLLTAHTQNDQAETLLLQLFRGAGPKGLAAMPIVNAFAHGQHLRPFLNISRVQLENYARQWKLQWIEDESNADIKYARNFLRNQVIPLLAQRWPALHGTLARSASHCAEANELLEKYAQEDLLEIEIPSASKYSSIHDRDIFSRLSIKKLLLLTSARQRNVIRFWLEQLQLPLPSTVKMSVIQHELLVCAEDATPLVTWHGVELRRYGDELFAMSPLETHDASMIIPWDIRKPLLLPNNLGKLVATEVFAENDYPIGNVTVRFRQGGEKCRLKNHQHTSDLKKLFQQWRVPPWQRDRVPLIYIDDKLKVIVGYGVCD